MFMNTTSSFVVHGFLNVMYDVVENNTLETVFKHNVKGERKLPLDISGIITAVPNDGASELHVYTCSILS